MYPPSPDIGIIAIKRLPPAGIEGREHILVQGAHNRLAEQEGSLFSWGSELSEEKDPKNRQS